MNLILYPTYIQGEPARQESIVSNLLECEVYSALSVLAKEKMYSSFKSFLIPITGNLFILAFSKCSINGSFEKVKN